MVFGIQADRAWNTNVAYIRLLDDGVIAHAARYDGVAGIAVDAPRGVRLAPLENVAARDGGDGGPLGLSPWVPAVAAVAAAAAVFAIGVPPPPRPPASTGVSRAVPGSLHVA